jgi:hypothetical protein
MRIPSCAVHFAPCTGAAGCVLRCYTLLLAARRCSVGDDSRFFALPFAGTWDLGSAPQELKKKKIAPTHTRTRLPARAARRKRKQEKGMK